MECDLTVQELFQAYFDCRKNKRNTFNALKFEENLEKNIMELYRELVSRNYSPGRSIMFVVLVPKPREIWAAEFRDRIVHHVLYNRYSQIFYNSFISDSFACIPGRGTLSASKRLEHFVRSGSENYTKPTWFLKADIANFFVTINKSTLEQLLSKKIKNEFWFDLTKKILYNDPRKNSYIRSSFKTIQKVPRHKSLLTTPNTHGLPVGNLSSQLFANVYLNLLDQFVKHKLKARRYVRYVDDVVIIENDPVKLNYFYDEMNKFIKENLGLTFHPNKKEINLVERGINFVGYIIKPFRKYIRRSTINNLYKKTGGKTKPQDIVASVNSYFGFLRQSNSYTERKKFSRMPFCSSFKFDTRLTKIKKEKLCLFV